MPQNGFTLLPFHHKLQFLFRYFLPDRDEECLPRLLMGGVAIYNYAIEIEDHGSQHHCFAMSQTMLEWTAA
jgi:hypothetical protein